MTTALRVPAGWFRDPIDGSQFRYWDGDRWTTFLSTYPLPPLPLEFGDSWWDLVKAGSGLPVKGVDLRARDLRLTATRVQSEVHFLDRAEAAQVHASPWRALRLRRRGGHSDFVAGHVAQSVNFGLVAMVGVFAFVCTGVLVQIYDRGLAGWLLLGSIVLIGWCADGLRTRAAIHALRGEDWRYPLVINVFRK